MVAWAWPLARCRPDAFGRGHGVRRAGGQRRPTDEWSAIIDAVGAGHIRAAYLGLGPVAGIMAFPTVGVRYHAHLRRSPVLA
jgi:hypothetical protein